MAKKRYYESREEKKNSGMLSYDHSAVANMPQQVKYHEWPGNGQSYIGDAYPALDDTIKGCNSQISEDVAKAKKHTRHNKW